MSHTNFVQDYVAKRQQQMDRAKLVREERIARQKERETEKRMAPRQARPQPAEAVESYDDIPAQPAKSSAGLAERPHQHQPPDPTPAAVSLREIPPAAGSGGKVLQVAEEDFRKATKAGIITPDQSRQLWAMLSNQIIRVAPPSSNGPAPVHVTMSALSALSHTSSMSSTVSSAGFQQFGRSITMDSLRQSIAQYKAEQQQHQGGSRPSSYRHQPQQQPQAYNDDDLDDEPYHPPESRRAPESRTRPTNNRKPEWNSDFDMNYDEPVPPPEPKQRAKAPAATAGRKRSAGEVVSKPPPAERPESKRTRNGAAGREVARAGKTSTGSASASYSVGEAQNETPPPKDLDELRVGAGQPIDMSEVNIKEPLAECRRCGRSFRVSRLSKHENICLGDTKRKPVDLKLKYLAEIDGLMEAKRNARHDPPNRAAQPGGIPKWKIQHEQLQAALKSMHSGNTGPAPEQAPDDRVPCPHCGRKFAFLTAERHIPACASTKAKPKGLSRPIRR
eukprot:gene2086-1267_t